MRRVHIVDSHTGGEPTRVVLDGRPRLGGETVAQQCAAFAANHDRFRAAVVCEPRGSDVLVGALLVPPADASCVTGVIFFNNVGVLGMCGHGTIGLVATLAHLGKIEPGAHKIETPVGIVSAQLHGDGSVSVQNVPAYRYKKAVPLTLASGLKLTGDIAWGGNWFFLCDDHGQFVHKDRVADLTNFAWEIRRVLEADHITGENGAEIDHIELVGASPTIGLNARNFVLCPGGAYDRSPCGTGTSAKIACLAADGKLQPGQTWKQESIVGSVFDASFVWDNDGRVIPTIRGRAWVNGEATLVLNPDDPFCWGI